MKMPPKHILLVEDEAGILEAFRVMLSIDKHMVAEAKNGAHALELFAKDRFDLVLTDFAMPGMSGSELAVRIKRLAPLQPILMITGYLKELGDPQNPVDAILTKPFSLAELRQAMAKLVS
jgi:CheY-like chemotaxis protein